MLKIFPRNTKINTVILVFAIVPVAITVSKMWFVLKEMSRVAL